MFRLKRSSRRPSKSVGGSPRSGRAKEAARTVLNFAFESLKLDRVVAFTVTGNAPSWGLMERLGMRQIGEFDNSEFPEGHRLRRNVVYEMRGAEWRPT